MTHVLVTLLLVTAATWDAWRWYLARIASSPEEAVALGVTVLVLAVAGAARRGEPTPRPPEPLPLLLISGLLALYAASFAVAPAIVRAAIAISVTLYCLHVAAFGRRPPPAFWGLIALALPVLPSLQFVLGYPLRIVSAALTVGLLRLQGLAVERQGTFLVWRGEMVQFDAPCSGVNMLWAGLLLTLLGSVLLRLGTFKVMLAVALSVALTIGANVLRASSLFYVEIGLIANAPAWWHDAIGLAAFLMSALATLWLLRRLSDTKFEHAVVVR